MKIKKNDIVLVISGKDRAKTGKVLSVLKEKSRIIVEGINLRKKHVKPKKSGEKGQTVEIPASMHVSNVKLVCAKCGKAARVGYKVENDKKFRICKKCKQEI